MSPTPEDLRQRFEQMSSRDLLAALDSQSDYTSLALEVVRRVLEDRGVDSEGSTAQTLTVRQSRMSSKAQEDYLAGATREIEAGRLWRAKEILAGNLPERGYDLALYEAYGALLARMGDDLEAGRFLFLSGSEEADYREAVELYLRRFGEQDWKQLAGTFPAAAKLASLADYPESVRTALRRLGRPEVVEIREQRYRPRGKKDGSAKGAGCVFLVLLFLFASLVVGAITIIGLLLNTLV